VDSNNNEEDINKTEMLPSANAAVVRPANSRQKFFYY
jgi:hypothetical protein